jgi:multidrug efflux pump subunit AcrB
MTVTNLAIKYRTSVVVLLVLLVLGGLVSYLTIPKEANPSIEIPTIVVTTIYPGASPDDVETLITQKIEQEVASVTGIKELRSTSTEGVSTLIVEFEPDVEMDDAYQKVRDKVDTAQPELPSEVEEPIVSEINLDEEPIMSINLAADYGLARLKEVAEDLQDELEAIPAVLEVDLFGGLTREVQVNVNLAQLQGYNLTFNDLIGTIQAENTNLPGGSIDVDRENYLVRVDGQFERPEQIESLVVSAPGGVPIYVRDVADVDFGFEDRATYARLELRQIETDDGFVPSDDQTARDVITLSVKKRSGENILETAQAIDEVLEAFALPPGTQVLITGDASEDVETLITDLENNIIAGLIFVVLVLLFFLGVRNATLVGIAIPISMLLSMVVFQVMGYSLNFIILFSLIIALGMLVDNAIVIVENIYRFREEGFSRWDAARQATAEVAVPVITSTATTLAVFAPMLFWPGIIGAFMGYMPLTLIITLSCSLVVALIFNPVVTGFFVKVEGEEGAPRSRPARIAGYVAAAFVALLILAISWRAFVVLAIAVPVLWFVHTRFFQPIADRFMQRGLPALTDRYRGFIRWMLRRDYTKPRALLRNTLALTAFTAGFVLLLLGAFVGAVSDVGGMALMALGGLGLLVGLIGILFHAGELVFYGDWGSVKVGLVFGAVMLVILGLMSLSREVGLLLIAELLVLPALIVLIGLAGAVLRPGTSADSGVLTDNRARLLTTSLAGLFAIVGLFALAPTGVAFFPETDPNQVRVTLANALGTNLEASDRTAREAQARVEELLADNPQSAANVRDILINVGVGGDAMFGGGSSSPERSRVTLNMVDYLDRAEPSTETLARIRDQLTGIPGAQITIDKDQQGPPTGAPVNIEISGEDFATIQRITDEVRGQLEEWSESGAIPGLVDVDDNLNAGRPELEVNIDRERAAQFGLSTQQIAQTVRAAINGIEAGTYRTGEDEFDIVVRLAEGERQTLESVRNLTILHEGQQIPLASIATLETGGGLGSITRLDQQRVATVTAEAAPGFNGNAILADVQARLAEYEQTLPPGYTMDYTGESQEQADAFGFLGVAMAIGVGVIFMILVAQFNSLSGPFIIIVAVGLSLIGVLTGLILTRTPFGLFTFIGIISLAGIVVNNAIVLIDYIMQLRGRGMDKQEAIVQGGATRLRPVLLTALTTLIGLVPLTFGINIDFVGLLTSWDPSISFGSENTQFWGPMGTAIISGLIFGTFLTLVIVPVMYSTFDSLSLRLGAAFASPAAKPAEAPPASPPHGDGLPAGSAPPVRPATA